MCEIIPEFLGHKIGTDLCEPLPAKKKKLLTTNILYIFFGVYGRCVVLYVSRDQA